MPSVNGVGGTQADTIFVPPSSSDPLTVAAALSVLKLKPTSTVVINDSVENIQKNLDALQKVAAKITSVSTTDVSQKLTVSAAQYSSHQALLTKWGAGDGNTVDVTGVKAGSAASFIAAKPSYVATITVADTSANVQKNLDALQTLVSSGDVRQIVQTGAPAALKITAAQLAADGDALGAIKNHAYTLAVTDATVSDTLGLGASPALTANAKIKSIAVKDATQAIEDNLDALQRVGLRLKSISQTDASTDLNITGTQYTKDSGALGKILTNYHLDIIRASAAQSTLLTTNNRVVTLGVADTAANLAKKWSTLQQLADDLTSVEVTDSDNAISISGDQLALSESLLGKFLDDDDHTYKLAITGVKAGQAAAAADVDHVTAVSVSDSADNVAANLDSLESVNDLNLLHGINLTGKAFTLTLDAARLTGDPATATQGVLSKITTGSYSIAVTGVSMTALGDLASNARIVSMQIGASSSEIHDNLDSLYSLGKKVSKIQQSDSGTAIDLTQATFESRASVLAKIDGGYAVNLSAVTANKILADVTNAHVASVAVADTGKNLLSHWSALRAAGDTLGSVTKSDDGSLALSIAQYETGRNDNVLSKFSGDQTFSVSGANAAQAADIGSDDAVDQIDVTDDGSSVAGALDDLGDLVTSGKLHGITLNPGTTNLALHFGQLDDASGVLALINGGHYTLAVDEVGAADAKTLATGNSHVASIKVSADADDIASNLTDLASIGHKLTSIEQTDADDTALTLTGTAFEQNKGTLAKISGGYQADLTSVTAAKAASLADSAFVKSLALADTGANLAKTWDTLSTLGAKLTDIAQSDSTALALTMKSWTSGHALADKFSTDLAVSVSGAAVSDLASLDDEDAVTGIRLKDNASTISDAWSDLAADSKLTQVEIADPTTALEMSAATFGASSSLLGIVKDGNYQVALSAVDVADASTLGANSHVTSMDVTGASSDIASNFNALAALDKVNSIALGDEGGTLTLSSSQILNGTDTLAKISNDYSIAATGVSLADLDDVSAIEQVATIGVSDTAENVSDNFDDLLALGGSLSNLHLTDTTPVLALTQADWTAGAETLGKIDGSYQVDLSEVEVGSASDLASDSTVHQISVSDTAGNVASNWSTLVSLYDDGNGKLAGLNLTDDEPLTLTEQQQTDGAAMITALIPDATIETA